MSPQERAKILGWERHEGCYSVSWGIRPPPEPPYVIERDDGTWGVYGLARIVDTYIDEDDALQAALDLRDVVLS